MLAGLAPPAEGTAVVTLLLPPPLERPMRLEAGPEQAVLMLGELVVAAVNSTTEPVRRRGHLGACWTAPAAGPPTLATTRWCSPG
ncbi:hypothetical protein [Saccharothrix saharensis]|uniref:hypothetical protein n=1 Tax=Saccharothrix saharensis TaxID=571190 RepID=UPI001154E8CA|nr:hypothetical protein [Saccharothrix saharensis]